MSDEKAPVSRSVPSSPPHPPSLPLGVEAIPAFEPILSLFKGSQNSIRLPDSPTISTTSSVSHHPNNALLSFRPPISHARSHSSSSLSGLKGISWFPFSSSSSVVTSPPPPPPPPSSVVGRKPNTEVRMTVLNLVRDLVLDHSSGSPAALGILQSCAEACNSHSVSLSEILQDKFIESHSPLYWAIVKRGGGRGRGLEDSLDDTTEPDLLDALLKQSTPLNHDTLSELRQACVATSDHSIFQRLSVLPHFTMTSGVDRVIHGAALPPDDVTVELGSGDEGAFTVHLCFSQFHKRMGVSKEITHEFVARNRLWKVSFLIIPDNKWSGPPPGSWCVSLSLQESSPPTWFDGQLSLPNSNRPLRLRSKQMLEGPRNDIPPTQIVVPMGDNPDFATLQYSGSSFNPEDEQLRMTLEAKLRKYDFSSEFLIP